MTPAVAVTPPDPLTHLLNELARGQLGPIGLEALRAAVRAVARPMFDQLPTAAAAAAEQQTWVQLLDHFPPGTPTAVPVTHGTAYIQQIAHDVRAGYAAAPVRPARRAVLPWLAAAAAVLLFLVLVTGLGAVGMRWWWHREHAAGTPPYITTDPPPTDPAATNDPISPASPPATDPIEPDPAGTNHDAPDQPNAGSGNGPAAPPSTSRPPGSRQPSPPASRNAALTPVTLRLELEPAGPPSCGADGVCGSADDPPPPADTVRAVVSLAGRTVANCSGSASFPCDATGIPAGSAVTIVVSGATVRDDSGLCLTPDHCTLLVRGDRTLTLQRLP
jgi:hypothetical protein